MKRMFNDPLLSIARALLLLVMGVLALAGAAATIGIPFILFNREKVLLAIAKETAKIPPENTAWAIAGLLLLLIGIVTMLFFFVRHMKRIVDSVADGDPFIPENATRLTAMAWLMLAIQLAAIPVLGLALYVAKTMGEAKGTVDVAFDANGIIMVILLFILARVFRHGTALRDDLEGTV